MHTNETSTTTPGVRSLQKAEAAEKLTQLLVEMTPREINDTLEDVFDHYLNQSFKTGHEAVNVEITRKCLMDFFGSLDFVAEPKEEAA